MVETMTIRYDEWIGLNIIFQIHAAIQRIYAGTSIAHDFNHLGQMLFRQNS